MKYPDDLRSRAGELLYRELPEEYRYQDPATKDELGDLEAYLHGFGHLLDLIRHTTEQAYADAFAEETDQGYKIQPWLIPYLAELVGAELVATDPDARIEELNNSVLWSKSKGTLRNVDSVSDVISTAETVVREGWRLTLTTPRTNLPPFSLTGDEPNNDPLTKTLKPLGCPDLRKMDRAVVDPSGSNPLFRLRRSNRDENGLQTEQGTELFWKPRAPGGAPCFPMAYDDGAARCPDLRDPAHGQKPGPHPTRNLIHLVPPDGFFEAGLKVVKFANPKDLKIKANEKNRVISPREILELAGDPSPIPDRLIVALDDDLNISKGAEITFEDILFMGRKADEDRPIRIRVLGGGQLTMRRSTAQSVTLAKAIATAPDLVPLIATDSLFETITGPTTTATLVYCTVMGTLDLARLNASDCLFADLSDTLKCEAAETCVRYSRLTPPPGSKACLLRASPANTATTPRFTHRWLTTVESDQACTLRLPQYGEPGYGVLDTTAAQDIASGAEDEGEMGAYHHKFYAASLRALQKKLTNYLPLGQEIALIYDPHLSLNPPVLAA